ncbi:MAG: HNH endonuclease [Epsilonproteobacteria bacterium]|nr:HNH endonuclease [Campylobacterota bacterium]
MTKVEAIKQLMKDNEGLASWSLIYKDIEKYYPKAKISKEWKAGIRGVLYRDLGKSFKKIDDALYALIGFDEEEYLKDKDDNIIQKTEKISEIKVRIGQQFFKKSLLKELKECPFTNIEFEYLLIASHIKPWSKSNDIEKLDTYNGFIFTPTYDKLFDNGFITFKNNKTLIISNRLDNKTKSKLHIKNNMYIPSLPIKGREIYLEYHRDVIFKSE